MPNGKPLATDGPLAETKEQLAGFYLVEASDVNEAVGIAAQIPGGRYGSNEVRPILKFSSACLFVLSIVGNSYVVLMNVPSRASTL